MVQGISHACLIQNQNVKKVIYNQSMTDKVFTLDIEW